MILILINKFNEKNIKENIAFLYKKIDDAKLKYLKIDNKNEENIELKELNEMLKEKNIVLSKFISEYSDVEQLMDSSSYSR